MAQNQNSNQNLIRFLYGQYRQRGLTVFSDFLSESAPIPESWTGTHPDLLVFYSDHNTAICIETLDTLADEKIVTKWEAVLKNHNTKLRVIAREDEEFKAAKQLAKLYNLNLECKRVKRTSPEKRRIKVKVKKRRSRKIDWVILVTSLMILSVTLLLFGPVIMKLFKVEDYYRPFDSERQMHRLQKQLEK